MPPDKVKECFSTVGPFGLGIEACLGVYYVKSEDKGRSKHWGGLGKGSQRRSVRSRGF